VPPEATSLRLTLAGALARATHRLAEAGLATPRRDAIRILADLLDLAPASIVIDGDRVVEPERRRWLDRAIERRAAGEPLAYVTGLAGFRRLVLRVDRRALIPRPETEGLVDRILARCPNGSVADVGTGTGCIALALRDEGGYRQVTGVDRSPEALALAAQNGRRTGLPVRWVRGDLTTGFGDAVFDAVVANPPYVSSQEYLALDPSVRDYEPRQALESGPAGLDASARLAVDAWRAVRPGGLLALEIAEQRPRETAELVARAGWSEVVIEEDLFGRPRYLLATKRNDK